MLQHMREDTRNSASEKNSVMVVQLNVAALFSAYFLFLNNSPPSNVKVDTFALYPRITLAVREQDGVVPPT